MYIFDQIMLMYTFSDMASYLQISWSLRATRLYVRRFDSTAANTPSIFQNDRTT